VSTSAGAPVRISPPGHDLTVWGATLAAARHLCFEELVQDLGGPDVVAPTLIVVSAHPDDETIGLGRLAYAWATTVGPVVGVLATAGEACVDGVLERPPDIALRREAEWHDALDRLGIGQRYVLGLPDGELANHEDTLVARLREIAEDPPRPIVLAGTWHEDPHPDHRAVGRAVRDVGRTLASRVLEFPVWMTYWSAPASVVSAGQELLVVSHDEAAERAREDALQAYPSQLAPLSPAVTAVVEPVMLTHQRHQLLLLDPAGGPRLGGPT